VEKLQRNRAVLFPERFTTVWRSEIHIDLKTDAGVAFVSGVQYVISIKGYGGHTLDTAHACKTHKKRRVKSKPKKILPTTLPVS
jgi:hypothetical protein